MDEQHQRSSISTGDTAMDSLSEDELGAWCVEHGLTEDTGRVLREEGFTTLRYLCLLTPEEVDESFKQPRLLPLAQCLALKHAVAQLGQRQSYAEQREDPTGQCQNHAGQGQGFGGQPQNHTGQRRDLSGQRRNHEGQRQDLSGQRQNHAGQRQGLSGQSQNQFGQRQDLSRQHQDQQKRRRDPSGQLKSMGAICNFEEEDVIEDPAYRFLLVGKTGSGKSATGNSILGAELFDADVGFDSHTRCSQLKRGHVNGKLIEIMDSPGLFDITRTHEEISNDIVKSVACMYPGPHAILYIIRLGRYTEEEFQVYKRLKALFDEQVTHHVIVVLTGGDGLEKEEKGVEEVLRQIPASLKEVLDECQHRVVVFNNVADDKRLYVTQLLLEVDKMLARNGGRYYVCPKYANVGKGMEEEVARRLDQLEQDDLTGKLYVQELKRKAQAAEDEIQRERTLLNDREKHRQQLLQEAKEKAEAQMETQMRDMKEMNYSMEQQRKERERLLQRHEDAREEQERELERQRQQDQRELNKKQEKVQSLLRKMQEERRKAEEARRREIRKKMAQMKDEIAQDQKPGFLEQFVLGVKNVIQMATSFFK